jgi:hypothetical protein|tara:strand:+ start:257 stop:430 length:174 start_codon:yes stop_codon:yes gene_type:complete
MTKRKAKRELVKTLVKQGLPREKAKYLADYFSGDLLGGEVIITEKMAEILMRMKNGG